MTGVAGLQKTQRRSASARKPKLKIQPDAVDAKPVSTVDDAEEPDIEYCPPKITGMKPGMTLRVELTRAELPDASDDDLFPEGLDFSHFQGQNLHAGWLDSYLDEVGEDGLSRRERDREQKEEAADAYCDRLLIESLESTLHPDDRTPEFEAMKKAVTDREAAARTKMMPGGRLPKPVTDPQKSDPPRATQPTLNARSAANALSGKARPHFAAPTAAANAKRAAAIDPVKRNPPVAASRSTIGYSKGRKVSSTLRQQGGSSTNVQPRSNAKDDDCLGFDTKEQKDLLRQLTNRLEGDDSDTDSPLFDKSDTFGDWFEQRLGSFRLTIPEEEDSADA